MQDIHKKAYSLRNNHNPISLMAQEIAKDNFLLCFDELQVLDIADAMLLRKLFVQMYRTNVVTIFTSNRHPDELYLNGIQRKYFLPVIDLIKEKCLVYELCSGIDYRLADTRKMDIYFEYVLY